MYFLDRMMENDVSNDIYYLDFIKTQQCFYLLSKAPNLENIFAKLWDSSQSRDLFLIEVLIIYFCIFPLENEGTLMNFRAYTF